MKKGNTSSLMKLEDQVDTAWQDYSLDAPKIDNPIPQHTKGLRQMCIVVQVALPLLKIIFGSVFYKSCPTNHVMPTYMIVGGILQFMFIFTMAYRPWRQTIFLPLFGIATLLWNLIASINIFLEWKPDFFLGGWRYCDKTFFYFVFFISAFEYIIAAVLGLYICTIFAYKSTDYSAEAETASTYSQA
ncbi:transmembrane protein 272-like [Anthonomus grandis grandis]|uniref:transmembrane protein 272-like n=1 Tax=Anthonomus grandis grandis TaxID=2921223 RepID=UPI0021651012|nr:transmembrane protein 272-like [Anthonomus grandis grandis]